MNLQKKKIFMSLLLAGLLIIVTACGNGAERGTEISKDLAFDKEDYKKVVSANNELGFKLLEEIETDENGNSFISPTSLLMALSMVYNGADGVTKEEIATTLRLESIDVDDLNKANASLISMLHQETDAIQLDIANSIWLNERFHFQDDFALSNKAYFNAAIEEIDITDKGSANRINEWVRKATNEKIEEIVEAPLNPDLVAILVNALYFKGDWTYAFDKEQTNQEPFHLEDGAIKDVSLMTLSEELDYLKNENFQAVKLPYGNEDLSMTVFLPTEETGLEDFKKRLTAETWAIWEAQFRKEEGTVRLPKFQVEYEVLLKDTLQKLGMATAFDRGANFEKMIKEDNPVWISEVKQKTYIDVNEKGTEAAAVTSVEMKTTSAPIDEPFQMKVNRPFFITISDNETNTILFMGSIANPLEM